MPQSAERAWSRLREGPKHRLCRHDHSCAHYVIKGFLKTFGLGYTIQGGLKLLTSLTRAFRQPGLLWQAVTHKDNFNLAAFLGSFSAIFRAVSCVLRWVRDKDEELHGLVAGFLAGASMMWYKSVTITLYMATKLAEILYFKGIQANILPYIKCADVIIYSISTAFIFHGAVFEPHNLRPAYWRFLVTLTETKFAQMNRAILDVYGTNASKLMPNFWPDFDKRFSSLEPPVRLVTS
ncbi:transmembrane protein 135-like [Liolophura sinensis]|uniref:transmembrane protein 135-like n=1 Tax=Liolophura sinensis TaxID=3198878 RepID=UPI003158A2E5